MKRFKFRLDPVIRHREYLERLAMLELAKRRQVAAEVQKGIDALHQERKRALEELFNRQQDGMSMDEHGLFINYLDGLAGSISQEEARVIELSKAVAAQQAEVMSATTRKKTIQKLRENQYKKFLEEVSRKQQKELDELVALRRES